MIRNEFAGQFHGVDGRFFAVMPGKKPGTFSTQKFIASRKTGFLTIKARIRFDDDCGNGHNTFSITGEIIDSRVKRDGGVVACGCIHDDIAAHFPELAPLIRWHLCSSDGPMHYIANTCYHASDRDHNGKAAGEPWAWDDGVKFGGVPIVHKLRPAFAKFLRDDRSGFDFVVICTDHDDRGKPGRHQFGPKWTFGGFGERWHQCPFDTEAEAFAFLEALQKHRPEFVRTPTQFSEGKARDLDAARAAAIWPDAPDAVLCQPREVLAAALAARLPALIAEFRAMIESGGFLWSSES